MTTTRQTSPPTIRTLPPLQDDRLYPAEEVSAYTLRGSQWLKRSLRNGAIPGGYIGRTPCWTAEQIRELIAQTQAPQKRPSRGGSRHTRSRMRAA